VRTIPIEFLRGAKPLFFNIFPLSFDLKERGTQVEDSSRGEVDNNLLNCAKIDKQIVALKTEEPDK